MEATAFISPDGTLACSGVTGPVPWWSFSKTVLAIASLRLVATGIAGLDDQVEDGGCTLRRLLRHEAGLPDYGSLPGYHADVATGREPWPVARLLAETADQPAQAPPGTWTYSNVGYLKVAQWIGRTTREALAPALDRLVFRPAGLASARLALRPADLASVSMGDVVTYHPGWVYHGLVVGTAADAARLLHRLVTGKMLPPALLAAMMTGRPLPEHRSPTHPDPAYGLGLMLSAGSPHVHPMGHSGAGPGSRFAAYASNGRVAASWVSRTQSSAEVRALRMLAGLDQPGTFSPARTAAGSRLPRGESGQM